MKISYIELLGKQYPLCFSLAAAEELSDHFGGLDKMEESLVGRDVGTVSRAADKVLSILLKAGRIYAQSMGEEAPPELPCRPADLIDARDPECIKSIFSALKADTEREVEAQAKNGEATQGQ